MKLLVFILKNLGRNKLRSALTALSIFFLVAILTLVSGVLRTLETAMREKERDIKLILTERADSDSFSLRYMEDITRPDTQLNARLREISGFDPDTYATWNFVLFTLDKEQKDRTKMFITIATQPEAIPKIAEGMEDFREAAQVLPLVAKPPRSGVDNIGLLMGPERMQRLGKKVGDVFRAYAVDSDAPNQQEFEFEIVGALPATSRWTVMAFMDITYLRRQWQAIKHSQEGRVDLGWLVVQNQDAATRVANTVTTYLPQLKCETLASAFSRFLEPYKDILAGVKYVLVPAIYFVMTLIVANALGITVRERRKEIAVLKVLGFRGGQILSVVLGEGLLLGVVSGALGAWSLYTLINLVLHGIKFPIGFFPIYFIPDQALWWGPAVGAAVAFVGCVIPAWNAKRIKVVDVFSKVA